jgi:hypothetical protein
MTEDNEPCCNKPGCCGSGPNRRDFLRFVGLGAAAAALASQGVAAESPGAVDLEKLVPADKGLKPEWVKSLFARGTPTVYRGKDLEWIGMPIGGMDVRGMRLAATPHDLATESTEAACNPLAKSKP